MKKSESKDKPGQLGKQKACRAVKQPRLCESKKREPVRIREAEKGLEKQESDEQDGTRGQETWKRCELPRPGDKSAELRARSGYLPGTGICRAWSEDQRINYLVV